MSRVKVFAETMTGIHLEVTTEIFVVNLKIYAPGKFARMVGDGDGIARFEYFPQPRQIHFLIVAQRTRFATKINIVVSVGRSEATFIGM